MLNLQVVSDLHFELHPDAGRTFIEAMDPTGVDILVLAGDITTLRFATQLSAQLRQLAAKYPKILYVTGNHELWGTSPAEGLTVLSNACAGIPNVTVLNNQVVSIEGRRFLGGPMWFPRWPPTSDYAASQLPDFQEIEGFKDWVLPENKRFQAFLQKNLQEGDVVLTHYLPSYRSVVPRYKGSQLNDFFITEMDPLIIDRGPALWIHGHTHFSFDYQISRTRIVCNPRGYPDTVNKEFVQKLLIPIP